MAAIIFYNSRHPEQCRSVNINCGTGEINRESMQGSKMTDDKKNQESISLLDFLFTFIKNSKKLGKILVLFFILGITFLIFKPPRYTAKASVVAETNASGSMNLTSSLSALKSFGLNLGLSNTGLVPETYPKLIKSNEVLFKVIQDTFYFKKYNINSTYTDYINLHDFWYYLKNYTIKLPFTLYNFFKPKLNLGKTDSTGSILIIGPKEARAIEALSSVVNVSLDEETGIINITTSTDDPLLSAEICGSVLSNFRITIRKIYDQKNSENLKFINLQVEAAKKELYKAEHDLIEFIKRNANPQPIQLKTEMERLQRAIDFRANLYNEIQLQFAQTQIELKKQEPIIRVVQRPVPPLQQSGLGTLLTLFLSLFLGLMIYILYIIYLFIINMMISDQASEIKFNFIKKNLHRIFPFHNNS